MKKINTSHNVGFDREKLGDLEVLGRLIIRALRQGSDNAVTKDVILRYVKSHPEFKNVNERSIRAAIQDMRQNGTALICSTGGLNGGYWLAADHQELETFLNAEIDSRIADLAETKRAMQRAADRIFGRRQQDKLF